MKRCLHCNSCYETDGWVCPNCCWVPTFKDSIPVFSPDINGANDSYDPNWYSELSQLEEKNFWFLSRNKIIKWLSLRYLPVKAKYLEIGCGSGFVLQMLHDQFRQWKITASEAQLDGISIAIKRTSSDVTFVQMDACHIPFRNHFDVVGAFDVIEHIRNDTHAIDEISLALKEGGYLILTVPQHMFLWSEYDTVGCHFRRYSTSELDTKLLNAGFSVCYSSSFNSLLLPLMFLSRIAMKKDSIGNLDVLQELRLHPILNAVMFLIMKLEYILMRLGIKFPAGGSRIVVAQKNA